MDLRNIYPLRKADAHKGDFGYVLIVAGSEMYSGSPIFNAMAALRSGADLITVVGHRRAMDIAAMYRPDMITYPLEGEFSLGDISAVLELMPRFDALVIGGGMKRCEETFAAIRELILKTDMPMALDAEALRAIAGYADVLKGKIAVLTPNAVEFEILSGEKASADMEARRRQVKELAQRFGAVVVLKGSMDIISDGEGVLLNRTGMPLMTKGGFGDLLAGICASLLARGIDPLSAAAAACCINGRAGEIAGEKYGESLLASDPFEIFPEVIKNQQAGDDFILGCDA